MKRSTAILILAAWLAAVNWYWRENIPLVPTRSLILPADHNMAILSRTGELVVSRSRPFNRAEPGTGPFQFWSFPELKKVRETLRSTDRIVQHPNYRSGDVLIRRDARLLLCNLYSDAVLSTLPDIADVRACRVLHERQALLIQNGRDLEFYEFNKSEPSWKAADLRFSGGMGGEILMAKKLSPSGSRFPTVVGATAVAVATGEIDHRFDHLGPLRKIELSPDGRTALAFPAIGQPVLCDAATGTSLGTLPGRGDWWFSEAGDGIYHDQNLNDLTLIRYRSSDGALLTPLNGRELRVSQRQVTADGRFAWADASTRPLPIVMQWYNQATGLPASWRQRLHNVIFRSRSKVINHRTESLIGYFPDDVRPFVLNNNLGFATIAPGRVDYYALPPQRDWSWLARWALIPPTILLLLSRTWRRLRHRRMLPQPTTPGSPASLSQNPSGIPPAACVILDQCSEGGPDVVVNHRPDPGRPSTTSS